MNQWRSTCPFASGFSIRVPSLFNFFALSPHAVGDQSERPADTPCRLALPKYTAITLVHKSAMPIAVHAVRTFAKHFTGNYQVRIRSYGSLDASDEAVLLESAGDM